jgi:hypothetical protein
VRNQSLIVWFIKAIKEPRDDPFTRQEQFAVVFLGHLVLASGVTAVYGCTYGAWPPGWFIGGEIFIILTAASLAFGNSSVLNTLTKRYVPPRERPEDTPTPFIDRLAQILLLVAFSVQLLDVMPLLEKTGGAIDSPFAQLTVVFAIFTPYVANNGLTMLASLGVTIVFYVACVLQFDNPTELHAPAASYLIVNGAILLFTTFVTLFDSLPDAVLGKEGPEPESE